MKEDAILARLNHADDDRVITAGIPRQNPEKIAERSSDDVSPLNQSRFHTVCNNYDVLRAALILQGLQHVKS